MCAYNEASVIQAKTEALLTMAADYGPAEIFVFVDGAEDETAQLLAKYGDRVRITVSETRRGKTSGMKHLVAQSVSDLLLFTDANVVAPRGALAELVKALDAAPDICGASARLRYSNANDSSAAAGAAYWSLEEAIKRVESDRVGCIGVDGAMFVIERAAYPDVPEHLIEDLYVSLSVLIGGNRMVSVPHVLVEEKGASSWVDEFQRKERIACQAWNVHLALWPRLRGMPMRRLYAYVSHRVLKWLTPFTLLFAAFCFLSAAAAVIPLLVVLAVLGSGLAVVILGFALGARIFRFIGMALISLTGVGAGLLEASFTRRTYTVWRPAKSVRS
jgi:cellulose synthase/poly-beta-1,6-N-acetylglucosamine synthase-like glycosyltransferase